VRNFTNRHYGVITEKIGITSLRHNNYNNNNKKKPLLNLKAKLG